MKLKGQLVGLARLGVQEADQLAFCAVEDVIDSRKNDQCYSSSSNIVVQNLILDGNIEESGDTMLMFWIGTSACNVHPNVLR